MAAPLVAVPFSRSPQSLDEESAFRIKRLLEGGVKIPPQPRVLDELRKLMQRKEMDVRAAGPGHKARIRD